ncbi:MAG: uncharacterized protein JWO38_7905 [Gemmataceae bacterium]|nr:uncharacterized protein [Gemmataceae bacterium]
MWPEAVLDFSALDRMPTDKDLPCSDGVPLETSWHRPAINLLVESIEHHWAGRKDFFVGGDMFMYFSTERVFNKDFRGPDFFLVKGVDHDKPRLSWVSWQEGGLLPNIIIELGSDSTRKTDRVEKKALYGGRIMSVPEYIIYDPFDSSLIGWRRSNGGYDAPLEIEPGDRVWSKELELYVGPWDGVYQGHFNRWLRFFDVHGNLIPTGQEAEAAARAAAEAKANAEAAARAAAEAKANASEAEIERLKRELEALRQPPPTP